MTPTRRALSITGIATLALSLALSIGPAFGANPNSGTVKVHDASTGLEASTQGNEPWVCSFWVTFTTTGDAESGTWQLLSWPPTGDGTVIEFGAYDTSTTGSASTPTLSPSAGHYRFEWQVTDDSNTKNKTLWVADDCGAAASTPTPTASPTDEGAPSDDSSPSQAASPSDEPTPTPTASPTDEGAPSDDSSPSQAASPSQASSPSNEPTPTPSSEPTDEPSQEVAPSHEPAASNEPTPEQEVQHGNPPSSSPEDGVTGPATGTGTHALPDTSVSVSESGVLAAIGVMLILAAHVGTRRKRSLPTA
jgi:hypothetical protein